MPQVFAGLLCSAITEVFQDKRDLGNITIFECLPTMGTLARMHIDHSANNKKKHTIIALIIQELFGVLSFDFYNGALAVQCLMTCAMS